MLATWDKATDTPRQRKLWAQARSMEKQYAVKLRKIAKHVGDIVNGLDHTAPEFASQVTQALARYAEVIRPWARTTAWRVLREITRKDEKAWQATGAQLGTGLRREIATAPTGKMLKELLDDQVDLITSLPLEAAKRVHDLTLEALPGSGRAADIADEIKATGQVTASRATMIARTEVARAASGLTMVRAKHVGSQGYIWRTAGDALVRQSHKEMAGKFVKWDEPPELSDGTVTHAGMIYNCRCYMEPVLPDEI